jgi:hypothetical protein
MQPVTPAAPPRGFVVPRAYQFKKNEPLLIIQHPLASPLALAFNSVKGITATQRVEHNVSIEPGSSDRPA